MRSCFIWDFAFCFCRTMCSANSLIAPFPPRLWHVYFAALIATKGASFGTALKPARFRTLTSGLSLPEETEIYLRWVTIASIYITGRFTRATGLPMYATSFHCSSLFSTIGSNSSTGSSPTCTTWQPSLFDSLSASAWTTGSSVEVNSTT